MEKVKRKRLTVEEKIRKHKDQIKKLQKKIETHFKKIEKLEEELSSSTSYSSLLRRKEWKEKRKEIFKLKGKACSKCGATKHLQVHHLYYQDGKKPWEYPNDALVVLCKKCHEETHGIKSQ